MEMDLISWRCPLAVRVLKGKRKEVRVWRCFDFAAHVRPENPELEHQWVGSTGRHDDRWGDGWTEGAIHK